MSAMFPLLRHSSIMLFQPVRLCICVIGMLNVMCRGSIPSVVLVLRLPGMFWSIVKYCRASLGIASCFTLDAVRAAVDGTATVPFEPVIRAASL